jgi:hypothetical protein
MSSVEDHLPLIKEDGQPFSEAEVESCTAALRPLGSPDRIAARNLNSDAIAQHGAARMLIVSGPGTGKSALFKARLREWLLAHPGHRIYVSTFVRKLAEDLRADIQGDRDLSDEDKNRVDVMTLHRMARSIVEQAHGTHDVPLDPYCLVITPRWEEMVWRDCISLCELAPSDFPWSSLLPYLYDGTPPPDGDWATLWDQHIHLEQFYNALTFTDLILFATQAVREDPQLVAATLFIIDEFQDFNLAEEALIAALMGHSPAVLLAGDDDQVLYDELRRAHPDIIRGYYQNTDFVNVMLPFCSRSSFHICGTAEAFLASTRPAESIGKVFLPLDVDEGSALVNVVASTSPKTGVSYVKRFLADHDAAIRQRHADLEAGTEKDPYLLILTPARKMNFLNVSGARDTLQAAVREHAPEDVELGDDYWVLRDYYYAGTRPSQNFNLRKVLSHESVDQEIVTALLREAMGSGRNLADIENEMIRSCLDKCEAVRAIFDEEGDATQKAQAVAALGLSSDPEALAHGLERLPIGTAREADDDDGYIGQSAVAGAITVTTIVGAKGLSADHVIVLGCDNVNLARTSRCAFFVALTRARKSLILMACVGGGGAESLHPFVHLLPAEHTQAQWMKADGPSPKDSIDLLQKHLGKLAYAKAEAASKRK